VKTEVSPNGESVEVTETVDGRRFYKKSKTLDAVIIDADLNSLPVIVDFFEKNKDLKNITLVASSRTVDALSLKGGEVVNSSVAVFFASNFGIYNEYVQKYLEVYGERPSRLSVTLYETVKYALEVGMKNEEFKVQSVPVFVGLNGTMAVGKKGDVERFVNISKLQNGEVREILDSYRFLKK
jgi:hypothetical protein